MEMIIDGGNRVLINPITLHCFEIPLAGDSSIGTGRGLLQNRKPVQIVRTLKTERPGANLR